MASAQQVPTAARDGFLDAIKAIALWRVVVWHALAWPWLSWFAAMPAMFYVAGILLERSLDRHGYRATLHSRIRRLLLPFWAFGATALLIMVLSGWRPDPLGLLWWVVPLGDPAGTDSMPGLWIPLWYLRAYLWILIAAPLLSWTCRRLGPAALLAPAAATIGVWWVQESGHDVPLALADAAIFPAFAMAGMLATQSRLDLTAHRTVALATAIAAGTGAVAWALTAPPHAGIVNTSLPLHLLVGAATIAALSVVRQPLANPPPRVAAFIRWSSSRALTIYLWHGLGLVVADRLVHRHDLRGELAALMTLPVVLAVTVAAAGVFGGLEDRAAGRTPRRTPRPVRVALAPAAVLGVLALLAGSVAPDLARLVPSGEAVLAQSQRAELVEGPGTDLAARGTSLIQLDERALQATLDDWTTEHAALLDDLGTGYIEIAIVDSHDDALVLDWVREGESVDDGPFGWWSMSKTMTVAWMMRLAEEGTVAIDEPLSRNLADVPHADEFTYAQLAGHQAGLPSSLDSYLLEAAPIDEIGAYFETPDLAYAPGEGYDYSRVGYHLLTWGLEEASGAAWRDAMQEMADEAGVEIAIDEDLMFSDRITHPGDGTYRGHLWGAGGLFGTALDGARLFRWTLMEALSEDALRRMSTATIEHGAYYGLGLLPWCPCVEDNGLVTSNRVGHATATGVYVVDLTAGTALMLRADHWWTDDVPALEFDQLLHQLLDAAGGPER